MPASNPSKWVDLVGGFRSENSDADACILGDGVHTIQGVTCFFFLCRNVQHFKILPPSLLKDKFMLKIDISHTIHGWYIYVQTVDFYGKCRQIYHTWMLWVYTHRRFRVFFSYSHELYIRIHRIVRENRQDFFRWTCGSKVNFVLTNYIFLSMVGALIRKHDTPQNRWMMNLTFKILLNNLILRNFPMSAKYSWYIILLNHLPKHPLKFGSDYIYIFTKSVFWYIPQRIHVYGIVAYICLSFYGKK